MRYLWLGLWLCGCGAAWAAPQGVPWWNRAFPHRIRVTVNSGFYARTDYLVRLPLDFAEKLDEGSLRVVEWEAAARTAREVPSQIGPGSRFVVSHVSGVAGNGTIVPDYKRAGTPVPDYKHLCWIMAGRTPTLTERVFYVYFNARPGVPRPHYPPVPGADEPPPGNLLANPGFEEADPENPDLPAKWSAVGSREVGSAGRTDEFAHTGRFSVKVTNAQGGSTSLGLGQHVKGLKPGVSYLLRGWIKITEHQDGGAGLTVWYTPAEGQSLPGNNKTQAGTGGVADWTPVWATGVIYHDPDRGYSITVDKTLPGTAGGSVEVTCWYGQLTAYFDDLELFERNRDAFAPAWVTVGKVERR